jgi:hypothetical protein
MNPRRIAPRSHHTADSPSIILETDAAAIAARVSRPKADTTDIVINEQTLLSACEWFAGSVYTPVAAAIQHWPLARPRPRPRAAVCPASDRC